MELASEVVLEGVGGLIIQVEVLGGHSVVRQSVQVTDLMQ